MKDESKIKTDINGQEYLQFGDGDVIPIIYDLMKFLEEAVKEEQQPKH